MRSGTVAFKTLRCVIEVAYIIGTSKISCLHICISKISCLGEHNTQGTSTP